MPAACSGISKKYTLMSRCSYQRKHNLKRTKLFIGMTKGPFNQCTQLKHQWAAKFPLMFDQQSLTQRKIKRRGCWKEENISLDGFFELSELRPDHTGWFSWPSGKEQSRFIASACSPDSTANLPHVWRGVLREKKPKLKLVGRPPPVVSGRILCMWACKRKSLTNKNKDCWVAFGDLSLGSMVRETGKIVLRFLFCERTKRQVKTSRCAKYPSA